MTGSTSDATDRDRLDVLVQNIETTNTAIATLQHEQEIVALDTLGLDLVERAMSLEHVAVADDDERAMVDRLSVDLKAKRDEHEAEFRRYKDPVVKLGKFFDGAWRKIQASLSGAAGICDRKVVRYDREKREAADRERVRLQKIADKQAEAERQRVIKQTEKAAAKATGVEKQVLKQETKDLKATTAQAAPVVVPSGSAETAGQQTRVVWKVKVVNLHQLAQAVIDGRLVDETIAANESYLNTQARQLGRLITKAEDHPINRQNAHGLFPFPGVVAVPDERRGR
tara:strand:- start:1182 stop:2033 length:852 start_codon:yes stop_codon:yes gene_type:complete